MSNNPKVSKSHYILIVDTPKLPTRNLKTGFLFHTLFSALEMYQYKDTTKNFNITKQLFHTPPIAHLLLPKHSW